MGLKYRGKEIIAIHYGKNVLSAIYHYGKLVWQAVRSCFGNGKWFGEKPWVGDETWKSE